MSADKENNIRWVATRKVDGEIEHLYPILHGVKTKDLQKYLTPRLKGQSI